MVDMTDAEFVESESGVETHKIRLDSVDIRDPFTIYNLIIEDSKEDYNYEA